MGGRRNPGYYWACYLLDMQVKGTKEAFLQLISEKGIENRLGVNRTTVANWKAYIRDGKSISIDKMEEMLLKGGAKVVKEKVWEVNTKK